MSILIKGMEMPKGCDDCFLPLRYCPRAMKEKGECPLVELPTPHGRLIDAEGLSKLLMEYAKLSEYRSASWGFLFCANVIKIIKPVVEAEGGEKGV